MAARLQQFSTHRLRAESQRRFDRLLAGRGTIGLAKMLGVTPGVVEKLTHGGTAPAGTIAKVEAALVGVAA